VINVDSYLLFRISFIGVVRWATRILVLTLVMPTTVVDRIVGVLAILRLVPLQGGKVNASLSLCSTIFGGGKNHFTLLLYLTPKHVLETFGVQLLSLWLLAWLTASLCVGFLRNNQHEFCDVTGARNGEVLQEHSGGDAYRSRFSPACLCWISSRKHYKEVTVERIWPSGESLLLLARVTCGLGVLSVACSHLP